MTRCYQKNIKLSLKLPKPAFLAVRAHFLVFSKKTTPDLFNEKSKTGLGFEIEQIQRKCQRMPTLQSLANPVVEPAELTTIPITRKK